MTEQERDAIRARCETATDAEFNAHAWQDIPALLDALEEAESDRDYWESRARGINADRDYWKARAEGLEKYLVTFNLNPCRGCKHDSDCDFKHMVEYEHCYYWEFDPARFAGKETAGA